MSLSPATAHPHPPVVEREEWEEARARLLVQEKALTRMGDLVSTQRRRLPMVRVRSDYPFAGPDGPVTLVDLFGPHPQLIVQHVMYDPAWAEACDGCSMMAEHVGPLSHLAARRTAFALTSRAPRPALEAHATRMGWDLPWYSTTDETFNADFGATVDGVEHHRISVFLRPFDDERVYLTWSTGDRGEEPFMQVFGLLDLTPYGRQEAWEDSPPGWPQEPTGSWMRHADRYPAPESAPGPDGASCPGHP